MNNLKKIEKIYGVDIGFNNSGLTPVDKTFCIGKSGLDKNLNLEQILIYAYELKANIIVKAGKNAKWYIKKCNKNQINIEIKKQKWRDTKRYTMWILEWD